MSEIEKAKERLDESWMIFSTTGNTEDYSFLAEDLANLDLLIEQEEEMDL